MHYRTSLTLIYTLLVFACITQLALSSISLGGIDVQRYWAYSYNLSFSETYYLKEWVSWGIIKAISHQTDRISFLLGFAAVTLVISLGSLGLIRGAIFYACLLSPFGILLEFNVLRQCLSTIFIAAALFHLGRFRIAPFIAFSMLALFSHNFSIFIAIGAIGGHLYFENKSNRRYLLLAVGATFPPLMYFYESVLSFFGERTMSLETQLADGPENAIYLVVATLLLGLATKFTAKYKNISIGIIGTLLVISAFCWIGGIESWVFGRLAISCIVVATFFLVEALMDDEAAHRFLLPTVVIVLVANPLLILLHPGAMSMIGYGP